MTAKRASIYTLTKLRLKLARKVGTTNAAICSWILFERGILVGRLQDLNEYQVRNLCDSLRND